MRDLLDSEGEEFKKFNELYMSFYPRFVNFATTYVGDAVMGEDFVSEAFLAYWNNRHKLAPTAKIQAYIFTTIRNKCLNHIRDTGLRNENLKRLNHNAQWELDMRINALKACDPEEIFSAELQQMVDNALKMLPARTLEVFTLSRDHNKSYKEISQMLGISVKGVEFQMSKALSILRSELKDYLPLLIFLNLL